MAGQTTSRGLMAQTIGRYFMYSLLVAPAIALLMVMTAYVALRGNRVYSGGVSDAYINLGQESLAAGFQEGGGFAFDAQDAGTPRGDGRQTSFSYAIQGNDEDIDVAGTQEGYSNVGAMTAFHTDWGTEGNLFLSAILGQLKKTLPEARVPSVADHMVVGASEA